MSALIAIGPCFMCGQTTQFNPDKVPSVVICLGCKQPPDMHLPDCAQTAETTRMPLCRDCVAHANTLRERAGVPPIVVLPGAYEAEDVR